MCLTKVCLEELTVLFMVQQVTTAVINTMELFLKYAPAIQRYYMHSMVLRAAFPKAVLQKLQMVHCTELQKMEERTAAVLFLKLPNQAHTRFYAIYHLLLMVLNRMEALS